jgi:parallel beta-helix repeat protein
MLASRLIYSNELNDVEYVDFDLDYVLDNLPVFYPDSASGNFPTQNVGYRIVDYSSTKVFYEVDIPQGVDLGILDGLYIDYMKVTDRDIWEIHGDDDIPGRLGNYNQIWSSTDVKSLYANKMKFFYTLDEPHAYDRFHPYRIVESYMNNMSQFNNKFMLTKIYPEWPGEKEGLNVIRTWNKVVHPNKSMFWYYTVFNDNPGTILTHSQLRTRLQEVNEQYDDFYYTAQTFGARTLASIGNPNPTNADYYYYRTPTGSEALGQTTQALAYGCKGIFYETYYSYKSWYPGWGDYFAEGLVGQNLTLYNVPRENDFGLYDTIKSIGKRLKGTLGRHLLQLQYTKNDACIAYSLGEKLIPYKDTASITEFAIFDDNLLRYPQQTNYFNFGFTKFKPKSTSLLTGRYYFLLNINAWEIAEPIAGRILPAYNKIKFGINVDNLKNWHFYDIEGGGNYYFRNMASTTGYDFVDSVAIGLGDGRLYRLIPTVGSSGPLLEDEIIPTGDILSSEGTVTVPIGVTLKIEGDYTLTDSLIIEVGGVLTLEPGSTLNLDSASSVYCAGDLYINGTKTNKVTINFLQPNETKQNSIYLGRESSAIVKYADIKNGYSGISALNGFDTLIIDNCNFTNISHSALLLNGASYDKPLITNNTYTNCDYAGFLSNLSTVVINSDSANTRSGYCFSGVSDLWFGNNILTGTQEGVGLTLTGCFGNIYNNKITNHTDGILLANSFPKIGGNEISNNTQRGLVCEYGSIPDLETFSEAGTCEQINTYPLSGFNTIHDNGGEGNDEMNAKIYLDETTINMAGGTNAVVDDGSEAIIAGKCTDEPLDLSGNYWGETGFENLYFNLNSVVIYQPELTNILTDSFI